MTARDLGPLGKAISDGVPIVESYRRLAVEPVAMGQREIEGGVQGQGYPSDGAPDVPGREEAPRTTSRPTSDEPETHRLVDFMVPRETADRALALYDRYLIGGNDPVYCLQQACLLIAEELGWHRHIRGGGR